MSARSSYLLAGITLVCAVLLFVGAWMRSEKADTSVAKQVDYWKGRIDAIGPKAAYEELATRVGKLNQLQQHLQAHIFGEALYEQEGIGAIGTCDDRFVSGCLHEVIGLALSEHGTGAIKELLSVCEKETATRDNCTHSIGHGLIAHSGYSLAGVREALHQCDSVPNIDPDIPIQECEWGVLMEFNMRVMLGEGGVRKPDENGPYYPCDALDKSRQRICYMVQPQWWNFTSKSDYKNVSARFSHIGELCSGAPESMKSACFEGVGIVAAWDLSGSGEIRKQACESISKNAPDQLLCKSHLAYWLWALWHRRGLAARYTDPVCAGLEGEPLATCRSYAEGKPI